MYQWGSHNNPTDKNDCTGDEAINNNDAAIEAPINKPADTSTVGAAIDVSVGPSATSTPSTATTSFDIVETVHLSIFDLAAIFYERYSYIPFEGEDKDKQNDA